MKHAYAHKYSISNSRCVLRTVQLGKFYFKTDCKFLILLNDLLTKKAATDFILCKTWLVVVFSSICTRSRTSALLSLLNMRNLFTRIIIL